MSNRKHFALVAGLLFLGGVVWVAARTPGYMSCGNSEFRLDIERISNTPPIRAIRCTSFRGERAKESYLKALPNHLAQLADDRRLVDHWDTEVVPYNGGSVEVRLFFSGSSSLLGTELDYSHDQYLLVVADLADGRRVATIADIPDARATREMRVTLP